MKNLRTGFLFLLLSEGILGFGQQLDQPPAGPRFADCKKSRSYRRTTLSDIYPFKGVARIEAVSFRPAYESAPTRDGVIDQSKFIESKKLTKDEEEELVDILYNYTFDPTVSKDSIVMEVMMCYEPRNAFVFRNANGRIESWFEVCFECIDAKGRPKEFELVELCRGKIDLLKNFLIKLGIKYGTINTD